MLDKLLDALAPGWVGSVIGILGIAAAALTYLLGRQRSILAYRTKGARLLGHSEARLPSEVNVQYRGKDIPRLTRSMLVAWNFGEKTINGRDIVESDTLRIEMGQDSSILSATVLKRSRDVIGATCSFGSASPSTASIQFDYLDPGDGFVVEVLHTGERRHPKLVGTIKGIPQGPKNLGAVLSQTRTNTRGPFPKSRRTFAIVVIAIGVFFALAGTFIPFKSEEVGALKSTLLPYAMAAVGLLYAALGCTLLWMVRRRYPKSLQTEDLE